MNARTSESIGIVAASRIFRAVAMLVTATLLGLCFHRSGDSLRMVPWSPRYLAFLAVLGILATLLWRIALVPRRQQAVLTNLRDSRSRALVAIAVGAWLLIVDFAGGVIGVSWVEASPETLAAAAASLVTATFVISRGPKVLAGCTAALFAIVLSLLLFELILRFALLRPNVPETPEDLNSRLARALPPTADEIPGGCRIVAIGDSFGWNLGRRNFHFLLEAALRSEGAPWSILNLSLPALSVREERLIFREFGVRYSPDLVIHGFFVGNDFSVTTDDFYSFGAVTVRLARDIGDLPPRRWAVAQWLRGTLQLIGDFRRKIDDRRRGEALGVFATETFLGIERATLGLLRSGTPVREVHRIAELLDSVRRDVEAIDATYVLVVHPDRLQVETALFDTVRQRSGLAAGDFEVEKPQTFLMDYCRSRQINCLDLLGVFRAHGARGGLYTANDTHYSLAGNELAATAIADFLGRRTLTTGCSGRGS